MELVTGLLRNDGIKFCVYGPEGIGKSTFVSFVPGVIFIDTEGSTSMMEVTRYPTPISWQMLLSEVDDFASHPEYKSLVIDTADWAEKLCTEYLLAKNEWPSIEAPGYGKGYVYLAEEFSKLLMKLSACIKQGKNVGFTAHAMMRKFEQPDELGAYDRWELKMSKKCAPLIKEWSDILLFANYKTLVYQADKDGKKHKAAGGQRVMYTSHHPCWDAKNRMNLPEEMPFDFKAVSYLFEREPANQESVKNKIDNAEEISAVESSEEAPPMVEVPREKPKAEVSIGNKVPEIVIPESEYDGVPEALKDLMKRDSVTPLEVRTVVAKRGYFPLETPFRNYPIDFVNGVLIGAWEQVKAMVINERNNLPF